MYPNLLYPKQLLEKHLKERSTHSENIIVQVSSTSYNTARAAYISSLDICQHSLGEQLFDNSCVSLLCCLMESLDILKTCFHFAALAYDRQAEGCEHAGLRKLCNHGVATCSI